MFSTLHFQGKSVARVTHKAQLVAYSTCLFCVKKRTKKPLHTLTQGTVRDNSKSTCERLHEVVQLTQHFRMLREIIYGR